MLRDCAYSKVFNLRLHIIAKTLLANNSPTQIPVSNFDYGFVPRHPRCASHECLIQHFT